MAKKKVVKRSAPKKKKTKAKKPVRKVKAKAPTRRTRSAGSVIPNPPPEPEIDNVSYYDGTTAAELVEARGWHVDGYKTIVFLYLYRAGRKPENPVERDLKKVQWYLNRLAEIEGTDILKDEEYVELVEWLGALGEQHDVALTPLHETVWLPPMVVEGEEPIVPMGAD